MRTFPVRYRSSTGRPLLSVTQVLTADGQIDDTWFTPESAERGSLVHELTEVYDRNEPLVIPAGLHGYVDAYAKFVAECRPVYSATELEVRDETLGLAGRLDRCVVSLFGSSKNRGVLDFKSGDRQDWHCLQLAAYNMMQPTGARWAVYLGSNGQYRFKTYDDPMDYRRFMYALSRVRLLEPTVHRGQWHVRTVDGGR